MNESLMHFRRIVVQAPHRLGFLTGGLLLLASFVLWGVEIFSHSNGLAIMGAIPAMFWHGYVMSYGFFPLFMLGFIYTAGPRWLNVASPKLAHYLPVMLCFALGTVTCLLGRWIPKLMLLGVALHLIAWLLAGVIWWTAIYRSTVTDKVHATVIGIAFALGNVGMLAMACWLLTLNFIAWQWVINLGGGGLLLPVFLSVCHRMIPFFSGSALQSYTGWRPMWLLYVLFGLLCLRIVLQLSQINSLCVDAPLAALLLYSSWRWRLLQSMKVKLLAMLHVAFVWAGVALVLFAVDDIAQLMGRTGLGFAPLHALTLGFFCTMLLAFVTRVTLGHSGRPLVAGGVAWAAYWAMHGVAIARVVGELIPSWQNLLYQFAIAMALFAIALWSRVYLPMYWQARVDGKMG